MHDNDEEEEEENNDEESLDPAERRRQRMEAAASRPPIYNTEALHEKLEDISWPSEVLSPMSSLPIMKVLVIADPDVMGRLRRPSLKGDKCTAMRGCIPCSWAC